MRNAFKQEEGEDSGQEGGGCNQWSVVADASESEESENGKFGSTASVSTNLRGVGRVTCKMYRQAIFLRVSLLGTVYVFFPVRPRSQICG